MVAQDDQRKQDSQSSSLDIPRHVGLPPTKLELKVNTSVKLVRNLDISRGLVNGARCVVKELRPDGLVVALEGKEHEVHVLRRVAYRCLTADGHTVVHQLYPVRPAFQTDGVHHTQGMSLEKVRDGKA